jgi:uncharacterized repeat protein (TIGR01451 family)
MPHALFAALLSATLLLLPQFQAQEPLTETEAFVREMSALASDPSLILFKAGTFDPVQGVPEDAGFAVTSFRDRSDGDLLYVVQFRSTPGEAERAAIERDGGTILHYVPNNAYLVRIPSARFSRLFGDASVRAAFRLPKFAKLDPAVTGDPAPALKVELVAPSREDLSSAAGLLAKRFPDLGFISTGYHHAQGRIIVEVPAQALRPFLDLASGLEDVLSVLPWSEKQLLNDNSIWVGQNYVSGTTPIWDHGITGTGQIVCVNDSGTDTDMCYFRYDGTAGSKTTSQSLTPPDTGTIEPSKKIIAYYVQPGAIDYDYSGSSFHGTHVAGSVLGDNYATLSTPTTGGHDSGDGMAPNAKLVMQDVGGSSGLSGLVGDLDLMFLQAYNAGARIHSDSWGTETSNYDSTAMDMDEFMYRHEDFLFVVAMGNSGTAPGDGSIGSPATAKSVVSVGATTNGSSSSANNLMDYSRGPVDDGRRKPDVCSPGSGINSASGTTSNTDNNCSPKSLSGTSMATPTTSGYLALLRQYFTDGWYPTGTKTAADARVPSGALMKAVLVNGAMEMTGTDLVNSSTITRIPSMDQGWGRTHLENGFYFSGDTRRLRVWDVRHADGLTTGQQAEYVVNVPSNGQPLKVHLVWTDPESTTLAATNLVNNLDLEVVTPTGTVYRGNVFATGQSTTGGTADVLNPVEGFVLNSPATGNWTLRVKATSVPGAASAPYSNRQGYALVATYATCTSTLSAPTGLTATNNGSTGIDLSWNTVSGATGYVVYKAVGASPAAGDYSVLVQQAGTAFTDTKVQGGYTYWYKVRATDNCSESPLSSAAAATYSGNCTFYPTFSGIGSVTNDTGSVVCDLVLTWPAATSNCPLGSTVTYNIYRGTTPYFTLNAGSLLAHGVTGTAYTDYAVNGLTTYYYVVRAEDSTTLNGGPHNGGNQDPNTKMLKGTPWASTTTAGTFSDDGGDTNAKLITNGVWRVTNRQNHTGGGSLSYYNALDGNTYQAGQCADARTPPLPLQANAQLSYWVRYNIEYQWDGVVVEISTNGGSSWTALAPTGGYPSNFSQTGTPPVNACAYASTQACFNGPSGNAALTAWTEYTHDLSAYSGQTAIIRWNFSSDGGAEFEGFYLDDIAVTNASVYDGCATRDGIIALDGTSYHCAGDAIGIQLADFDLKGAGSAPVSVKSTTEPAGETVALTETPADSGSFAGSIPTIASAPPSPGSLSVTNGDTITVTYIDADDGHGGTNVTKTDTAAADCVVPVISNVQAVNVTYGSADITWDTNEAADSFVQYDDGAPPVEHTVMDGAFVTGHTVHLTGLSPCTTYYFFVRSDDPAGNRATNDNGGMYYSFETPQMTEPTYDSTAVPVVINGSVTHTSTITVPDNKEIQDLNVNLESLTHVYVGDVEVRLIAPNNTTVLLVDNRGGSGYNFTNTVFDDEAATAITAGSPPYTGSFRPEQALSAFDGMSAQGTWTLQIIDTYPSADDGVLNAWSLTFTYPWQACGPHGKYIAHASVSDDCTAGGAGDGDGAWDAGETVQFSVTVENDGTDPLTGVTVTLTPMTAGVVLADGTAVYNTIAVGTAGTSQAPHFTAVLPDTLACGSEVQFGVSIASDQGTWSGDTFTHGIGTVIPPGGVLLAEGAETGSPLPPGWAVTDLTGTSGDWFTYTGTRNPSGGGAHGGTKVILFNSYSAANGDSSRLYRTGGIAIPAAATSATLSFWMYHDTGYTSSADRVQPQVSTDGGGSWINVGSAVPRYNGSTGWGQHVLSLDAYIGQADLRVAFQGISAYGNDCHLDDIEVAYTAPGGCEMTVCAATGPSVQYDAAFDPNGTLVEQCGDGDDVVEPGEDWRVTVQMKNSGSAAATGTEATLTVDGGAATVLSGNTVDNFGAIAAGGTGTAEFVFRVVQNEALCGTDLVFNLTGLSSAEDTYPDQPGAFAVPAGLVTGGGSETASQVTTPLNATNGTADSTMAPGFTLATADTATLSTGNSYTPGTGPTATLFGPDDFANAANWTSTGGSLQSEAKCATSSPVPSDSYYRINQNQSLTLTNAISTVGYTNITVRFHGAIQSNGATLYLDWFDGTAWTNNAWNTALTAWQCGQAVALPAGAAGKAGFKVRFRVVGGATTQRGKVDYVRITGTTPATGSWTANARVSLVDPANTVTVLKGYGAADGSPYNVQPYYTGPGLYKLRLEENAGGTATLTGGSMTVVMNAASECDVSACGSTAPPPVNATGAGAAKFTKGAGNTLNVTYDAVTCSAEKVVILYGSLGTWTGYAGCAQSNGGNGGSTTIDSTGQTSTWYNLVWTSGTTAGHPGFATGGARTWSAVGFCGATANNISRPTCP